jgi:hypothetical protein
MKRTSDGGMKPLNDYSRIPKSEVVGWKPSSFVKAPSFVKPPNFMKAPSYVKPPTFWSGIASTTNPFANTNFHSYRPVYPRISAWDAICRDWDAIGFDMSKAMERFASKHPEAFPTQGQLFDPESTRDAS